MNYIVSVNNNQALPLKDIPEQSYYTFLEININMLNNNPLRHCVNYFGFEQNGSIRLICCIADDSTHQIYLSSSVVNKGTTLNSFTKHNLNFEKFEREIHENFNIKYTDHPWFKPVRYADNRVDKSETVANYPFFGFDSEELHEVGVGPVHAGIIEPGHFRFICNGEQIMHLEIQLGYQHRGVEQLFLKKKDLLQRTILAESIAGDTTVGHTTAFVNLWESLSGYQPDQALQFSRTLALEIERIAIHTGDMSALCTDIAYQLGNSVFGRLRTPIINYFQEWCGCRVAKGLIRPGRTNFPYTNELANRLLAVFSAYEPDFNEMAEKLFKLPSALSRFERTGVVTLDEAKSIGTVGMAARASGLSRDIRASHPHDLYTSLNHQPIIKHHGDVYSRAQIRKEEIWQSIGYVKKMIENIPDFSKLAKPELKPMPDTFAISLVEGWRGEICHCAITDSKGELMLYKIKDPSFHNWLALAQSVRNNEISDFPICNKSFNLSYCGHDL
ncbi:MAG TPA: NADH dehydrogenase subunit [Tenuifilaceae bacterium]|nr:NADH dehydrogenase subunit [Tenuifilaceae bacterium]